MPFRSPVDTEAGDVAFEWATHALQELAQESGESPADGSVTTQSLPVRSLAETAVLESLGLHHEDAEAIVTEVERRIEGLFRVVGTA